MSAIEEIKERAGIVDIISAHVPLKKTGRSYKGLCPFHSEKTPSFHVFPDKGNYHCFGCSASGDVFTFLMKVQNVDFPEALRLLADRTGVILPDRGPSDEAGDEQRARLYDVNAAAAQYFNHLLLTAEAGRGARDYLASRDIERATIESFQLGFAPDSWDALSRFLVERGYTLDEIFAGGLMVENEAGRRYDRFRGRLMFPVRDARARTIGFGARTLTGEQPKYLNTPQTPIFDKGGSLYGIDLARTAIREADRVVIVEGYVDVLAAHQAGTKYVVACLGTAITERHVAVLKRLTKHLCLALDPDAAGDEATLRSLAILAQGFDKKTVPVAGARGITFERKLDADVRVVSLPWGKDPDEVIREDLAAWLAAIEGAQPVVDYHLNSILAKADLSTAQGKDAALAQLLPVLRDLVDRVPQEHHIQRLAQQLHLSERTIAARLAALRDPISRSAAPAPQKPLTRASLDEYLLCLFLRYPCTHARLLELEPAELRTEAARQLLAGLREWYLAGGASLDSFAESLDPALGSFYAQLLAQSNSAPSLVEFEALREVVDGLRELRRRNLRTSIEELAHCLRESEEGGDVEASRGYIAKHEELLAELIKYEHNNATARVWRL